MKNKLTEEIAFAIKEEADFSKLYYYDEQSFFNDAVRWAKAIKEGRMICSIPSVSKSGMSRNLKFLECSRNRDGYRYYNFFAFMKAMGYRESRQKDHSFTIGGCGMDMVFHTNYSIIHTLGRIGILNKKETEVLAQRTPDVI